MTIITIIFNFQFFWWFYLEKISYIRRGEGEDLVFFHGYGASKECFLHQINYFSRGYTVTAFDFAGFGESHPLSYAYSVEDYADETEEFLFSLGIKRPLVVAHSFGGRVAVKMAGRSDCFKRLLITGGAGIVKKRGAAYKLKIAAYRAAKKIVPSYADKKFGSEEYRSLSPVMRESFKKIVNEDLRRAAENIRAETLFVYGEKDKDTPVSYGEIFKAAVKNSSLVVMKGCGHFAFLDDYCKFNMLAEEFFARE